MNVVTNNSSECTIALEALKDVIDPEIGLNILDLGLVYQIDFGEAEQQLFCTMTLTTQFCPMGESITNSAKEALQLAFPEHGITLELIFEPPWNPEMISDEGRDFLNAR
ncbi:MAG: metal-sulfur cluster assembly factor [Ginsengibacter sp.]